MLIEPTIEKLKQLRLHGMISALQDQLAMPTSDLSFEERLGLLVDREVLDKDNRQLQRRLKQAKLKQPACMENIDYQHPRNLNKAKLLDLASCQWVKNHLNIFLLGPTGTGKTYLACALSHKACLLGFSSRYFRLSRLLQDLLLAKADGSLHRVLAQLAKFDILILDDWGLQSISEQERHLLLELLDDRYQASSTVITSQLPIAHWHEFLNDPTTADAILDRIAHNAINIQLKGESIRKTKGRKSETESVDDTA